MRQGAASDVMMRVLRYDAATGLFGHGNVGDLEVGHEVVVGHLQNFGNLTTCRVCVWVRE
jgi:hypothetical protein